MWLTASDGYVAALPHHVHHVMGVHVFHTVMSTWGLIVQNVAHSCTLMMVHGEINHQLSCVACDCTFSGKRRWRKQGEVRKRQECLLANSLQGGWNLPISLGITYSVCSNAQDIWLILSLHIYKSHSSPSPTVTEREQTDLFDRMERSRCLAIRQRGSLDVCLNGQLS